MLQTTVFTTVTLCVAIVSLMAISACQPAQPAALPAAAPVVYVAEDALTYRWQAMAEFYEKAELLTRDDFDYEQAAEIHAQRWLAMGRFYEKAGLLTR